MYPNRTKNVDYTDKMSATPQSKMQLSQQQFSRNRKLFCTELRPHRIIPTVMAEIHLRRHLTDFQEAHACSTTFAQNSYTSFRENPTRGVVANNG
jgi:hypothetical protein